jgi:hypothetical protein
MEVMLLKVGAQIPSWWDDVVKAAEEERRKESYATAVHQWWDGLEWQNYVPPSERMYFTGCSGNSLSEEAMCMVDLGAWEVSDALGIDWLYKIAAHTGAKIREGIDIEIQNIIDLVGAILWM